MTTSTKRTWRNGEHPWSAPWRDTPEGTDFIDADYLNALEDCAEAYENEAPAYNTHESDCRIITEFQGNPPSWDECDCSTREKRAPLDRLRELRKG